MRKLIACAGIAFIFLFTQSGGNLPELNKGKHVIKIDAASENGKVPVIKSKIRQKAGVETIKEAKIFLKSRIVTGSE